MQSAEPGGAETSANLFLPSFCDVRLVFAVVVIAELFAFILALVSPGILDDPWGDLGLISLFMQWIALTSAAVLCMSRPLLSRLNNVAAAVASYLMVLLVTGVLSELAFRLMAGSSALPSFSNTDHAVFILRNLTISTVVAAVVLRYLYVRFQWRQQIQAEARARIQALQARIRPHFLFNSMNTIAALIRSEPAMAEAAIEDLADLFRAALNNSHERGTLDDELLLARRYLHIEKLRLGERLSVEWNMDGVPMDTSLPPLILQPLLENAIYHGIEPLAAGGTIEVSGRKSNGLLEIGIVNPVPEEDSKHRPAGNRMAQENIRQRLQIAFGNRAELLSDEHDGHYRVTLRFPASVIA
jgi:two-component system sensor histidine kinase AlgZ